MPTIDELKILQNLPLELKVKKSQQRIREWINKYGFDGVYISFSGGKDSTVLLDLIDKTYPNNNIPVVFVDTGLEYPEIKDFVKNKGERVVILRPSKSFKQVVDEYGYPFISKEVSDCVSMAKRGFKSGLDKLNGVDKNGNQCSFRQGFKKWRFLIDANFKLSDECCYINKKEPAKIYEHQTGRHPFLGVMAYESALRQTAWLETGCNSFESVRPLSKPMSFWTEQDVLKYIYINKLAIASVYGNVVPDEQQLSLFENETIYKTTGCKRTGCMYCGFGCHIKGDERFVRLKETHPQIYEYVFKSEIDGGLGYRDKIEWINEHGNLGIRY